MDKQEVHIQPLRGLQRVEQIMFQPKILCLQGSNVNPELPEEFKVPQAVGGGDCFFDSVAKSLKLLKPDLDISVKSLRMVCKRFAQRQLESDHSWLKEALKNEAEPISEYIPRIEFTVNDIAQNSASVNVLGLSAPIWGRSTIEGRIICEEFNVKLHVVEGKILWLNQIIDGGGSRIVDRVDYSERNTIHILNNGKTYFQPILKTQQIHVLGTEKLAKEDINYQSENSDNSLGIAGQSEFQAEQSSISESERPKLEHSFEKNESSEQESLKLSSDTLPVAKGFSLDNSNIEKVIESKESSVQDAEIITIKNLNTNIAKNKGKVAIKMVENRDNLDVQDDAKERFNRRPGTSGMSGQLYEINLLILFLLQGSKRTKRFTLASNLDEAGEFDDVVFKYESESGKSKIIFLQAKHRDNPEKKDKVTIEQLFSDSQKKDFNLNKYFNSYRKIKQQFLKGREDKIFGSKFEDVDFIIYTNALSTFKKNEEYIKKVGLEQDSILNWSEKSSYYYKIVTRGQNNEERISVLQYSSNCKKLADELAKSIFSQQGIVINKGILGDYHIPLAGEVIQRKDKAKEGTMKESFLNSNSQFKKAFFEEIGKRKEFAGKPEAELKSILRTKRIKVSDNFGKINTRDGKYPELLPNDVVSKSDIKEFLSLLKLFVEQCSEEDLSKTIKQKIQDMYKVTPQDVDSVFSDVQNRVLEWWKRGNYYLTETNRIFQDAARVSIKFGVKEPVILFTGRTKELQNLHKILQDGGEAVISQMASVTGLGGIGKSELARKYISEHATDYDNNVVWINADNYLTTVESFRRLAQDRLQISTKDENGKEREIKLIVQDVYFFFAKRHRRSLFIFDNAGKYKSVGKGEGIDTFLPSDSNKPFGPNKPFVLITSRFQEWGEIKSLPLGVFTEEEAVEFIRKALMDVIELEEKEVKRLGEELQYLPLALNQAVAYIKMENKGLNKWKEGKFTIGIYLEHFKEKANEVLSKSPNETTERYTKTVMTTWQVTIEKMKQKVCGMQALEVLSIIAYLAPNNIPIEEVFSYLISEGEQRHTAVELLDQYSMAQLEYGKLNIHRLVQQVTRVELEKQGNDNMVVERTYELLHESFPYGKDTVDDYLKQKELLPHLEAFLPHLEVSLEKSPENKQILEQVYLKNMLTWMGDGYLNMGNPRRQRDLLEQALYILKKYNGPDHINIAGTLLNLGSAYGALGDPVKQKVLLEQSLDIRMKQNEPQDLELAIILVNLGNTYGALGDTQKQKELLEQALKLQEKHNGPEHIEVARALVNLGSAYGDLGDYQRKRELLERALAIYKNYYGPEHFEVAVTLGNLGNTFGSLGDYQKQKELLEQAIAIDEKHYGLDHFQVARKLVNLGNAYGALGNHQKSKELLERALEIDEKFYGLDHFEVARTLVNVSRVYGALNDYQKARELLERAIPILEKHYGPDHFQVALALIGKAHYLNDSDHQQAKELLERTLPILEKQYGPFHFEVARVLVNLGIAVRALGDYQRSRELQERAFPILEKHYGPDHVEVAIALINLGNICMDIGDYQEQRVLLERALKIAERHYGPTGFEVARIQVNLAITYGEFGDDEKKKELLEFALPIFEKHYGPDHFEIATVLINLANAYGDLHDHQRKQLLLERAVLINEKYYGIDHFKVAIALEHLGIAYRDLGNYQKHKELLERALVINKKYYGSNHFEVAKTLVNLSFAYEDLGEPEKRKDLLERALPILEMHYGSDHFEVARIVINLGYAYGDLGDHQTQKELLARALPSLEEHCGVDHDLVKTISETIEQLCTFILYTAASEGNLDMVKTLVEEGVDILASHDDCTVLHQAVIGDNEEVIRFILEKIREKNPQKVFENINVKDPEGDTLLMMAVDSGKINAVKVLLEYGAAINEKNNEGKTALHWAAEDGSYDIIQLLLNNQADPCIQDNNGKTPFDLE